MRAAFLFSLKTLTIVGIFGVGCATVVDGEFDENGNLPNGSGATVGSNSGGSSSNSGGSSPGNNPGGNTGGGTNPGGNNSGNGGTSSGSGGTNTGSGGTDSGGTTGGGGTMGDGGTTGTGATGSGSCTAPEWDAGTTYDCNSPQTVSRNGKEYTCKWWTKGDDPATSGPDGAWTDNGPC